ncbi:MAG: PLP-dependent aminotransferase family protein, partial [Treponemataceae bacterium]|nr:PLP-dependent aminotransferase family protein [Treponemataceae bacterium]
MPIEPLFSSDKNSRVIYINTFSKTLSPSFRISYMVLPKKLLKEFFSRMGFFSCPVTSFEQFALARFIEDGHYEKHLNRMKNYYRSLRNDFIAALQKSKIRSIAKIKEENSGLHFLLQVESRLRGDELRARLNASGINIALLSDFYYDAIDENFAAQKSFVVNYSGLKKEKIVPTVRKMEKVFFE